MHPGVPRPATAPGAHGRRAVAAGAAAGVRRAGERGRHARHRAAPARPRGGAGDRRREPPARRRHASSAFEHGQFATAGQRRTPTPPGWRTRTPPRWSRRSAGRRPRGTPFDAGARAPAGGRAGGVRGAGRRRPRRRCTRCTGTCSATRSSTPPSTAGAGCSSPGCPARRWPGVRRRCAGRCSGRCRSPSRCPPTPPLRRRRAGRLRAGAGPAVRAQGRGHRRAGLPGGRAAPGAGRPGRAVPPTAPRLDACPGRPGRRRRGTTPTSRWFTEHVAPHLDGEAVRWVGHRGRRGEGRPAPPRAGGARPDPLARARRDRGLRGARGRARRWSAMAAGCLPSLLDDGVTGFLAADEEEFTAALGRLDELDPQACARVARRRFAPAVMAEPATNGSTRRCWRGRRPGRGSSRRGPGRPAVRR